MSGEPTTNIYRDTGCQFVRRGVQVVIPSCLACPRPVCRYDDPNAQRREALEQKRARVRKDYETGLSYQDVADKHDQSLRQVLRDLDATAVWGKRA